MGERQPILEGVDFGDVGLEIVEYVLLPFDRIVVFVLQFVVVDADEFCFFVELVAVDFETAVFVLVLLQQLLDAAHFLDVLFQLLAVGLVPLLHDSLVFFLQQLESTTQQFVLLAFLQYLLLLPDEFAFQPIDLLSHFALSPHLDLVLLLGSQSPFFDLFIEFVVFVIFARELVLKVANLIDMLSPFDLPSCLGRRQYLQLLLNLFHLEFGPSCLLLSLLYFSFELILLPLCLLDRSLQRRCLFLPFGGDSRLIILSFFEQSQLFLNRILLQLQMVHHSGLLQSSLALLFNLAVQFFDDEVAA